MAGVKAHRGLIATEELITRLPGYQGLKTAGDMGALLVRTVRTALSPPFIWVGDAIVQFSLHARRALVPLALALGAYVVGYGVFFFATLLEALGATDRQPGGVFVALVREIGVWVSTMIFAGVAGSAVCADLGARKVREELDALSVLGVDRTRSLVVPRVVAMTCLAPMLGLIGLFTAVLATYVASPSVAGLSHEVVLDGIAHAIIAADLVAFVVKLLVVGLFVGVVSCHMGLSSSGGAEGVGRAVNQTVVITFFGIWVINGLFNVAYLALFPDSSVLRG